MKSRQKNPPVPDRQAQFHAFYTAREQERIRRGDPAPEHIGRLAAREQIRRERSELEALQRSWSAS